MLLRIAVRLWGNFLCGVKAEHGTTFGSSSLGNQPMQVSLHAFLKKTQSALPDVGDAIHR